MRKKVCIMILCLCSIWLLVLSGCSRHEKDGEWNAICHIYVDNLPQEYQMLPETLRDEIEIRLSMDSPSLDRTYRICLTEENGYTQDVAVLPGTYSIQTVYVYSPGLSPIEAAVSAQSIELNQDTQTDLPVSIVHPEELAQSIVHSEPTPEILAEGIYSRTVQYGGSILNLANLQQVMQFESVENEYLAPGEVYHIPSKSHSGVFLMLQNTTSERIPVMDGTYIGARFTDHQVVFPGGLSIGTPVEEVAHAETGLLGTPNYCLGTPLIGMGLDYTTLVYLDGGSGDRISVSFAPNDRFVRAISYEFERYQ